MSFEINGLALATFRRIEPRNLRAFNHLRGMPNVVDQIFTSWNQLTRWLRNIEAVGIVA